MKKPRAIKLQIELPYGAGPMLDSLARGHYGTLYGRTREDVAGALARAGLIHLAETGALHIVAKPKPRKRPS